MGLSSQAVSTSPASLQIPASIGEVVDKITILELKAARLSGERLANVERERQLLRRHLDKDNDGTVPPAD